MSSFLPQRHQTFVYLRRLLGRQLSVSRCQALTSVANSEPFAKTQNNFKTNENKQTFSRKLNKIRDNRWNKSRTEETSGFDSRFGNTFGNLSANEIRFKRLAAEELPEDDDNYDSLEINRSQQMGERGYKRLLNECINQRPIQMRQALSLYNRMVSERRIPPHKTTYTLLLKGCAKVGYTEKAFQLLDEMLKYELKPTMPAITALFNACANCPFPEYGLEKARYLREWMRLEGVVANTIHYHSMIKAFGKLGDIRTAFELVDEMVANGQTTTAETFSMLLIACISDKESGLYEAIRIVHRMKSHRIPLDIYIFNLLLRAVRDCGIGSEDNLNSLISKANGRAEEVSPKRKGVSNVNKRQEFNNETIKSSKTSPSSGVTADTNALVVRTPNLLLENSLNESNVIRVRFDSLSTPLNRFLLFGGMEGFIKLMVDAKVRPNINTLTLMTELIDWTQESEHQILQLLDRFGVKADTDFFNILMKQICFERGIDGSKRILSLMTQRGLHPDIVTFGVLSLACNSVASGKQLLTDMESLDIKPNIQIMGALVSKACKIRNFLYINDLIDYMKDNDINPDQRLVEKIEVLKLNSQKMFADYDWNRSEGIGEKFGSDGYRQSFVRFKDKYEQWIQSVTLQEEHHPWHQFQFEEMAGKKGMHAFVRYMKAKIAKRKGLTEAEEVDPYEEDELYND